MNTRSVELPVPPKWSTTSSFQGRKQVLELGVSLRGVSLFVSLFLPSFICFILPHNLIKAPPPLPTPLVYTTKTDYCSGFKCDLITRAENRTSGPVLNLKFNRK